MTTALLIAILDAAHRCDIAHTSPTPGEHVLHGTDDQLLSFCAAMAPIPHATEDDLSAFERYLRQGSRPARMFPADAEKLAGLALLLIAEIRQHRSREAAAAAPPFPPAPPKDAFTASLEIRTAQGWNIAGGPVPVLYTDEINGQQVCRDDVWLCRTEHLAKDPAAALVATHEGPLTWEQAVRRCITDLATAERILSVPRDATAEEARAILRAPQAPAMTPRSVIGSTAQASAITPGSDAAPLAPAQALASAGGTAPGMADVPTQQPKRAIEMLVAAGHITRAKAEEAMALAAKHFPSASMAVGHDQHAIAVELAATYAAERDLLAHDAARYRLVRRGQQWSVINGIGDALRAEALDAALDAVLATSSPQQGSESSHG